MTSTNPTVDYEPAGQSPGPRRAISRGWVWAIGVVVIGGMLVAVMLPSLCRAREPANRIKCASNLRQIGLAIKMYANDNAGVYPPSLAILPLTQDITTDTFICPSSNDDRVHATDPAGIFAEMTAAENRVPGHTRCLSYVYFGQSLTESTVTADTVIAYEPLANHDNDGVNVLFGDGHVEWLPKEAWTLLARDAGIDISSQDR